MAVMFLLIIGICVYYLLTKGRFTSTHRKIHRKTWEEMTISERKAQREDEFQQLLKTIRENRAKRERGEYVPTPDDPAKRMYERELKKMFKPGFQDDPEWQRLSKSINETIERNRAIADKELAEME